MLNGGMNIVYCASGLWIGPAPLLEEFLPDQALEKLVEKNPEGANEYLDAKDKAYHFFIGIKSLTIRHSNVITWNMVDDLREEVHIMRDANDQERENLLRKEKK